MLCIPYEEGLYEDVDCIGSLEESCVKFLFCRLLFRSVYLTSPILVLVLKI